MNLTAIYRIIIFAWQGFWRNIWLSIVTITIIILAFISINFLLIVNIVSDKTIEIIKNKIDISVYFRPDTTESQVLEVQTYLSSLTQVKEIKYISQQEALEIFRQRHSQDSTIIESLEELENNPIGSTLQIKAKDIDQYQSIIDVLNNSKYKEIISDEDFNDHKLYINRIKEVSDNIKGVALFISIIFFIIAALIVFNTIRVAIYTHKQEIGIMKLVGASNWFIRGPFLLEAVFYGVLACLIAIALTYPLLNFIQPFIQNFFLIENFNIVEYFNDNLWKIFGLEILVIILVNVLSSLIAIRRYLKV